MLSFLNKTAWRALATGIASLMVVCALRAQNPQQLVLRGLAAGRNGNCAMAVTDLKPLLAKGLSSPEALNVIAVCESQLGQPHEATALFERIVKKEPKAWQAWNNLGGNYLAVDRPSDAVSAFRNSISLNSKVPSVWLNQAAALQKLGNQREAFRSVDQAELLAPGDPQIRRQWMQLAGKLASEAADLINHGQYSKARGLLVETQRPLENSAYWNNLLGYADFKLNDPKPALQHLQKALQLDPSNTDFLMDVGEFLTHYRAYHDALAMFQVAAERLPNSPEVKFGLAVSYILEDRREEAVALLEKLVATDPKFQPAYRALGECYEDAGRGKAMVGLGNKLIAIDASNPIGPYLVGAGFLQLSIQNGNLLQYAIPVLERAVVINPHSSRDHLTLGKAYEAAHNYSQAVVELKRAIDLNPQSDRAHYVLGQVYQRMGQKELAQAQFKAHSAIKRGERGAQYRLLLTREASP